MPRLQPVRTKIEIFNNEYAITTSTASGWAGERSKGIIYCHGSGDTAITTWSQQLQRELTQNLAQFSTVQSADWALQSFGSDTMISAVDAGIMRLVNDWNVRLPVALVGISMGGLNVLNYAVRNPDKVSCVAAVIGLTDLAYVYNMPQYKSQIDLAYGGPLTQADIAAHSPIEFANDLPRTMPVSLWTSGNDPLVLPELHYNFVAKRPETERFDLGNHGHGSGLEDNPVIADWVRSKI